jgi:hypothetical protein
MTAIVTSWVYTASGIYTDVGVYTAGGVYTLDGHRFAVIFWFDTLCHVSFVENHLHLGRVVNVE